MVTLTIKLPAELKLQLERQAQHSGRSVSALIREAVGERLRRSAKAASLYDRTRDLCGSGGSGRPDLATNPDHLRGFGE
jgi:Arc/MetJ-type ribon-helix-helix transcriptional regulator